MESLKKEQFIDQFWFKQNVKAYLEKLNSNQNSM